ncbi:MAG: wax ester/triacylglycerol synthase domain-containing protein, partial [Candidatus Binatia bacterium]
MKDDHESIRLPRRMAPSAALFWYGEGSTPAFRPVLAGLYLISGRPELVRVREAVAAAVAAVPRLRQRVVEAPLQLGLPEWIDDPGFDIDYHLRSVAVAAPGGTRELLDTSSRLLAAPFDR